MEAQHSFTRSKGTYRAISTSFCKTHFRDSSKIGLLSNNLKIKIYRTLILPVVLYGCEAWSLTLREERRLKAFENRVLRRVFGSKRDEVTGEWRKLHNEEINYLYSLPNIVRVVKSRSEVVSQCDVHQYVQNNNMFRPCKRAIIRLFLEPPPQW
jgi:hypothetical protein